MPEPTLLQLEQQPAPGLCAFTKAIGEANQFLGSLRCRAKQDKDALCILFETGLKINAVGPDIDVVPLG